MLDGVLVLTMSSKMLMMWVVRLHQVRDHREDPETQLLREGALCSVEVSLVDRQMLLNPLEGHRPLQDVHQLNPKKLPRLLLRNSLLEVMVMQV